MRPKRGFGIQSMKHRSLYGLCLLALMLFCRGPALADGTQSAGLDPDLKLVGTAVAGNPAQSLAVIQNRSTGRQRSLREGDVLGNFLIKKILFGQVIIDTGSGEILLTMRGFEMAGSPGPDPQNGQLDAEEVDAVIPDYTTLMQQIRVRSQFEGGRPAGFVIYKIEPGSIFERMGLANSDVILKVNGRAIASSQPVLEFYEALREGGTVALDIRREDRMQKLIFEIR